MGVLAMAVHAAALDDPRFLKSDTREDWDVRVSVTSPETLQFGGDVMAKSTKSRRKGKSQKPYPEFPLTAHPSGRLSQAPSQLAALSHERAARIPCAAITETRRSAAVPSRLLQYQLAS